MFSLMLILLFFAAVEATYPETLQWSESKFVLSGKADEYVTVKLGKTSLKEWSEWYDGYHSYGIYGSYGYNNYRKFSIGTWIKPDHHENKVPQYILEFHLENQYQIFINNGTLGYAIWDNTGNSTSYICAGDYAMSDWVQLMVVLTLNNVTLATRPLDKTTPFEEINCQRADFKTESSTQNTNEIWIGRGYSGQITPVFIDKYSSDSHINEMKSCLIHNDITKCRKSNNWHNYVPNNDYVIDTDTTIRREMDNEIRVLFNSDFTCKDGNVGISIDAAHFRIPIPTSKRERYYDRNYGWRYQTVQQYPANLTLGQASGNTSCNLTWDSHKFDISKVPLTSCGFQAQQMDNTTTLYYNAVYLHRMGGGVKLMDVACWYTPHSVMRQEISLSAYTVQQIHRATTHTTTPWVMSLNMFGDANFTKKLENPVMLMNLEEQIFVEGIVTFSDVTAVELAVESCKTRVSLNKHSTLEKVLIEESVPVSDDVRYLNSTSQAIKRFVFNATVFEDYPNAMVYLTCVMSAKLVQTDETA